MISTAETSTELRSHKLQLLVSWMLNVGVLVAALLALALSAAVVIAPRLSDGMAPDGISPDGGHAYTFNPGFSIRWPYVVPSHPEHELSSDDVRLTEDGRPIGTLEPSHEVIRQLGQGRHNLWQGTLWFSTSDDTDPRTNARTYGVEVQTRLLPSLARVRTCSIAALLLLVLCRLATSKVAVLTWVSFYARIKSELIGLDFVRQCIADYEQIGLIQTFRLPVAMIVLAVLLARLIFIPPVFWGVDSLVLVGAPLSYIPHWPWVTPVLTWVSTKLLGLTPSAMRFECTIQVIVYGLSVCFLSSCFSIGWVALLVAAGILLQFPTLVSIGGISTEPLAFSSILLSYSASVIWVRQIYLHGEPRPIDVAKAVLIFLIAAGLSANTRLPFLPLICTFPVTVTLYYLASYRRKEKQRYAGVTIFSCALILLACVLEQSAINSALCSLVGNIHCVSPYGKSGSEVIAVDLRKLDSPARDGTVKRLQSYTSDSLVKRVFQVAADDTVPASWLPIQLAIIADVKASKDPQLQRRVERPGELETVMGRATWIFQTKGGSSFWNGVLETAKDYLTLSDAYLVLSGNIEAFSSDRLSLARSWFSGSVAAVSLVYSSYPDERSIFPDQVRYTQLYDHFSKSDLTSTFDMVCSSVVSEYVYGLVVFLMIALYVSSASMMPTILFLLSGLITVSTYCLIMAASVGPILNRYRDPIPFAFETIALCAIAITLDLKVRRSRAGLNSIVRWAEAWSEAVGRLARYIRLTFGRTFALVGAVLLLGFRYQSLAGSMPLLFQIDGYGYIHPGLVWAAGGDMAGQSSRDLGYPALTLPAARLGSLATLPRLQLFMVSAGLACSSASFT